MPELPEVETIPQGDQQSAISHPGHASTVMGITVLTGPGPKDFPHLGQFATGELTTSDAQMIFPNGATGIGKKYPPQPISPRAAVKPGLE